MRACQLPPGAPAPAPASAFREHAPTQRLRGKMARGRRTHLATPHWAAAARPRTSSRSAARGPARVAFPTPSRPAATCALPVNHHRTGNQEI